MPADRPHLSRTTAVLPCLPALGPLLLRAPRLTTPEVTACMGATAVKAAGLVRRLRTASPRFPPGIASGGPTP
jgi:hypothetical protein